MTGLADSSNMLRCHENSTHFIFPCSRILHGLQRSSCSGVPDIPDIPGTSARKECEATGAFIKRCPSVQSLYAFW